MTAGGGTAIVIGGGLESLAAAAALARAGGAVLLLERRGVLGGQAATEEFAAGFRAPGIVPDACGLRPEVVDALDLRRHGLRRRAPAAIHVAATARATPAGGAASAFVLGPDDAATAASLGPISTDDAAAWSAWRGQVARFAPALRRLLARPAPDPAPAGLGGWWELGAAGFSLRRLGRRELGELLRVLPMCAADWLNEWFTTPALKGALAAPAVAGTWLGPWSAGSAARLLLRQATRGDDVAGGAAALSATLVDAAHAAGAELRTGAEVASVHVEDGRVRGVRLVDGEALDADLVVSGLDPRRTLLELLDRLHLPQSLRDRLAAWRCRGTTAVVRLALDGPLPWAGASDAPIERAVFAGDLDDLERAFDAVKERRLPDEPFLDLWVPSVADPSLAPSGGAVVSVAAHGVAADLDGGWDAARRRALGASVLARVEAAAPGTRERLAAREVLAPPDLAERYGLTGGQLHHGEFALDQLLTLRPDPLCSRHATPVAGLYLCGPGVHPGPDLPGLPGLSGARAALAGAGGRAG